MFTPDGIVAVPQARPPFILLFAPNGHGKTTFVLSSRDPFVLDTENKYNNTSVARYVPSDFNDAKDCLNYLLSLDKFPYGLLAIDTLDWLEKRIHENICKVYKVKGEPVSNINEGTHEQLNFGKGSKVAANEFNSHILNLLEEIRNKHNIPIILCAQHAKVPVNNPDADKYDILDLRLDKILASFISDRVEAKMFIQCDFDTITRDKKTVVIPRDRRYLVTRPERGIAAKNSLGLPSNITIGETTGWDDFVAALTQK